MLRIFKFGGRGIAVDTSKSHRKVNDPEYI